MKYKVTFNGFAYVEADTEEEATEKVLDDIEVIYSETQADSVIEVADFEVEI